MTLQSVPISIIHGNHFPISHLTVPVLDQDSIILRVQNFLNKKNLNKEDSKKKKMSECRKLFQKNNCELFAFPKKKSLANTLDCGELFFCPFFQETGVVLCFFPIIDASYRSKRQPDVAVSIFHGTNYPEFNDPFTAFFSSENVSFLIFEKGSINTNTNNNCTLLGVEFMLLKHKNLRPTLLCKKTDDRAVVGNSILVKEANFVHQRNENYILINCLSQEKGFCIPLKFPILTEQAVKEKILHAQILRSENLNSETDIVQSKIFQTNTNCLFFLPTEISLNLPFHGLTGGKVYFSCKEDSFLQITVWSDFFELNNISTFGYTQSFSLWQVDKCVGIFRKSLPSKKIFILQDPNLKLVQIGDFQYLLKNVKMQFVFQDRSLGLFFIRTQESDQSSQAGEAGPNSSSMQLSTSQTSTCTTDPQAGLSQDPIGIPYVKTRSFQSRPSLPISIINGGTHPIFHLIVPVLDQDSIILRVQDFLNKKNVNKTGNKKKKMSECRKLFQKNNCELFALPRKRSDFNTLNCGELFFCPFFQKTGVVLCFFPIMDTLPNKKIEVVMSKFKGTDYPKFNDPFTAFLSSQNVSFLIFEEGWINTNTDNNCTLSGVEFIVLKHKGLSPTLLCKKTDDRKVAESSILVKEANFAHQRNENYIFINCLSQEEGFNISLRFPILTEQAVKEKIIHAQALRSKSLNTTCMNSETDICQSNIFQMNTNCLFFFPITISLDLPFNGLIGGKVYFSYKKDKSLQVTVWSDFFESGNNPIIENIQSCSLWQVDKFADHFRRYLFHTKIFILQDPNLKLVQVGDFQYLLKDAKMQFVFQDRSLGLFFLRTKEPDQSSQTRETDSSSSSMQSSTLQTSTLIINPQADLFLHPQPSLSQTSSWTTDPQVGSLQWSMNMPYTQSSPHSQPSLSQTSSWTTDPQAGSLQWSMNMPYTQSFPHSQPSLSQTSSWTTDPQAGSSQWSMNIPYTQSSPHSQPSLSQTSSWTTDPQAGLSQWSMNMPYTQSSPHSQPNLSQTSSWTTDPQAGLSQWSMNMPYTQSSPHSQPSLSQTSSWTTDPQAGLSQWSMNMPYTQSSPHPQPSLSQTSSWITNPQTGLSQWSMNMPYTQSSPHPQPSLSQTSSWITNPQTGSFQSSMNMPYTQPDTETGNQPHASIQMPPFCTEGLSMQGALDSSQLTFEDVNQINAETWEQLNVILQDVSTATILEYLERCKK